MAGKVERITTPCFQVLLAMKTLTSEKEIDFKFTETSEAFQIALEDLGLGDQLTPLEKK